MKDPNTSIKYYKVIGNSSPFMNMLSEKYDIHGMNNIPYNTEISAEGTDTGMFCIQSDIPVIHFSDNVFDTMLWQAIFDTQSDTIYEIEPLTPVIKERCEDLTGLYQCGTTKIKIIRKVSTARMFNRAIYEYLTHILEKRKMYSNLAFSKIIIAWIKHKNPEYLY